MGARLALEIAPASLFGASVGFAASAAALPLPAAVAGTFAAFLLAWSALHRLDGEPETIDELLEMVAEDGTHSILDIEHVGPRLDFGVAAPLPASRVARVFGSPQPTHDQVEANWGAIADGLERWQAYYLTVYRDGQPAEYAFIGCSGD